MKTTTDYRDIYIECLESEIDFSKKISNMQENIFKEEKGVHDINMELLKRRIDRQEKTIMFGFVLFCSIAAFLLAFLSF